MDLKLSKKFKYRVQIGDDISTICAKFNASKENILRNNYNIPLYAGEWIEIKVNDYVTHIVKPAETLKAIAEKYEKDIDQLKQLNNLDNEKLYIGQIIKIYDK